MERDRAPMPSVRRVGLRFARRDAPLLRNLADRASRRELGMDHVQLFEHAAEAAATGEPLIVVCHEPFEAEVIAAGFALYGVSPPTLDELTGLRPAR